MKNHDEIVPRSGGCHGTRLPTLLVLALIMFSVTGCGSPTVPVAPFPGYQEVDWQGVVFSATSELRGDSVVAELIARNPGGEIVELDLPIRGCMGYLRVYAEGDWERPVLETMDPFGVWCGGVYRDEHVAMRVEAGGSFQDENWVYTAWPASILPPGRYRAAILIRPGYVPLEEPYAPVFLLQAGAPFEVP